MRTMHSIKNIFSHFTTGDLHKPRSTAKTKAQKSDPALSIQESSVGTDSTQRVNVPRSLSFAATLPTPRSQSPQSGQNNSIQPAVPHVDASSSPVLLSRPEQISNLRQAAEAIRKGSDGAPGLFLLLRTLQNGVFDADLATKKDFVLGLGSLLVQDFQGAVDALEKVLEACPDHRSASVYQLVACNKGLLQVPQSKQVDIALKVKQMHYQQTDSFARIMQMSARHQIIDRQSIRNDLFEITKIDPKNALAWSALAAHCFTTIWNDADSGVRIEEAQRFACEALRLNFNDMLAFSVLSHVTYLEGAEEFRGRLRGAVDPMGLPRLILPNTTCDLNELSVWCPLFVSDSVLLDELKKITEDLEPHL